MIESVKIVRKITIIKEKKMGIGIKVELRVEDIANSIKKLNKEDKETLLLLLSGKGKEIKKRLYEIKSKKVKTLSKEETFKGVL
ncbi:MAG: hypothetical protein DWB56_13555 [Candidatus Jettenia sp.]|uniref:Uncharacterized protein n=2 Tax=Candidatus Jettenia TaxID=360731 RepID=I3IQR5_9BACT|nr:MAG: hypothetical protein EDM77_12490 [Candidatus Jettenia sp. AMX1]MBC6929961.1 hypothetical protein [Candidatus Jettenia sp.]WKZ15371.1 MAG: hypothetical protein QY317_15860 [Candidatus Jettenia caeni]MCE7882230.1 hypothetical protein [Candidatus Jettenia sp. AMX1]MCQ3928241.1 hypothetical protein [Candidatus Jettenia sp.]